MSSILKIVLKLKLCWYNYEKNMANRIAKGLLFPAGFAVISNIVYDSVVDPDPNSDGDPDSMGSLDPDPRGQK
jgi:hypothetical protein